jgi:hypothetical protein
VSESNLITRIPIGNYLDKNAEDPSIEFSTTGESLCVWWWPHNKVGDYTKDQVAFLVFDLDGKLLEERSSADQPQGNLKAVFPSVTWRFRYQEFLRNTIGWYFDTNLAMGVRVFAATNNTTKVEMWQLEPTTNLLWINYMRTMNMHRVKKIGVVPHDKYDVVLVPVSSKEIALLNKTDGNLQEQFTYGHIETDQESINRKKRFKLQYANSDPALKFTMGCLSYDPSRRYIACGSFFDRRMRVVRSDSLHEVVFEAHSDDDPKEPEGGVWNVSRVEFLGSGRFLLAEQRWGGRGSDVVRIVTDIYETDGWKQVWNEDCRTTKSVTLTPDGTKLGCLRNGVVEIHNFRPGSM